MKVIGVNLNKPVWLDFVMAAIAAVVVGLIGAAVSIENVPGLMLAAALVALISCTCRCLYRHGIREFLETGVEKWAL